MEAIQSVVTQSPSEEEVVVKGKAEKKSGKRIGYNYIILKSLKESQKNDVVKCLYIKSLTNFGFCVIKEGTYGDSKDKQGRDIKDRLQWQKQLHAELQDIVRLPRLLGSFEENGNYYLVLERIKGKSLYKAIRENSKHLREALITGNKLGMKFLDYMIQIIDLLDTMHRHQVVHRDVTATNFMIMPNGRVAIIDMELSYSLKQRSPDPPFQLGTYGYMSPEQEATAAPAVEQEVFSVGAIILQVWTGISPTKLTNAPKEEMCEKVHFFIPHKAFADIIVQSLHPDSGQRPTLAALRAVISDYQHDLQTKGPRALSRLVTFQKNQIFDTVQQAIGTIASPLMADEARGWFSEDQNAEVNLDKKKINKAWYTSFNKGACGVIYMISKANTLGLDIDATRPFIFKGIDLIETKYISRINDVSPSLHFGGSGIAASLSAAMREGLIEPQAEYFAWINQLIEKDNSSLGFMHGVTGQGIAHWLCHPFLNADRTQERLHSYVTNLLGQQEKDGSWVRGMRDKKKRITRGFAHGVAGIIYFLLEFAERYQSMDALEGAQNGLHWLMKKSVKKNGAIQWRSSANNDISPWFCEGAPGIALSFMKAYTFTGEKRFKDFAVGALANHDENVVDNNLSQCHGLAGLGEIYLEAHRMLKDQEWLDRASWIAQVIMQLKKQNDKYGPYWLVEHERQPTADFMIGNSGILHFLLRYSCPEKIGFPLLPQI